MVSLVRILDVAFYVQIDNDDDDCMAVVTIG